MLGNKLLEATLNHSQWRRQAINNSMKRKSGGGERERWTPQILGGGVHVPAQQGRPFWIFSFNQFAVSICIIIQILLLLKSCQHSLLGVPSTPRKASSYANIFTGKKRRKAILFSTVTAWFMLVESSHITRRIGFSMMFYDPARHTSTLSSLFKWREFITLLGSKTENTIFFLKIWWKKEKM